MDRLNDEDMVNNGELKLMIQYLQKDFEDFKRDISESIKDIKNKMENKYVGIRDFDDFKNRAGGRVDRLEKFIISIFAVIGLAFLGGLLTLIWR